MIGIINYGLGNIKAFANVYKHLNMSHAVVDTVSELKQADKLVLPGVGAFDYAMQRLNDSGMRETLDAVVLEKNVPVIGVCVGMQMLAKSSEEGELPGLGWIAGEVKKFDRKILGNDKPMPHMGWNTLKLKKGDAVLGNLGNEPRFYFLHSYYFVCDNSDHSIAVSEYGEQFSSAVHYENVYGIQCHPEKSHKNGVQLLKNFGEL